MKRVLLLSFAVLCLTFSLTAQRKSISSVVDKMQKIDGYMPVYFNADDGKIYLEVTRLNTERGHPGEPRGIRMNRQARGWNRGEVAIVDRDHRQRVGTQCLRAG